MTQRIIYFNDEGKDISVKIIDNDGERFFCLPSAQLKTFSLNTPEGTILWVKKWCNTVMISYIEPSCLEVAKT